MFLKGMGAFQTGIFIHHLGKRQSSFRVFEISEIQLFRIAMKLKRMKPGGSILLLKLTKLTNLTKPKLMKKNVIQM
jgi:hypothetical protein